MNNDKDQTGLSPTDSANFDKQFADIFGDNFSVVDGDSAVSVKPQKSPLLASVIENIGEAPDNETINKTPNETSNEVAQVPKINFIPQVSTRHRLLDFVKSTKHLEFYTFEINGSIEDGNDYIQAMRSQLARMRNLVIQNGAKPKRFSMNRISVTQKAGHVVEIILERIEGKRLKVEEPEILAMFMDDDIESNESNDSKVANKHIDGDKN